MSWRDRYQQASFRGVPFFVADSDTSGGRKTVKHEYVLQDIPFMEDMGRQAKEFSVSAYVLGVDYDRARDALQDALDTAGPGELVHPYYGSRTVVCTGYSVSHSQDEGGICRLRMSFIEAGEQKFPVATTDRGFTLKAAADALTAAAQEVAEFQLKVEKVAEFVRAAANGELRSVAGTLLGLTFPGVAGDLLADYDRTVGLLYGGTQTLWLRVVSAIGAIRSLGDGKQAADNLGVVRAFKETEEPGATPSRLAAAGNRRAVGDLIRTTAAAEQAQALLAVNFGSYDEAVTARDDMAGFLDDLADTAADEVYVRLQALRAEVVAAIPGETENLPRLAQITLREALPSLVLAYDLYEDVGRTSEIVARNAVRHPGFVPGGVMLEVLTRE